MSLNIKNKETHRLAQRVAKLTGESMTTAVTRSLEERLARLRPAKDEGLSERLLAIGRDCAARMTEEERSIDHGELLYDDLGLPK